MRNLHPAVALFALFFSSGLCHADTYTYSLQQTIPSVSGTDEDTGGVPLFDPDMGTLNSVTQTLTANFTFDGTSPSALYEFNVNGPDTPITTLITGNTSQDLDVSVTSGPTLLGAPGSMEHTYIIEPFDITTIDGTLTFTGPVLDTFTFNYTPAPTPEPASYALFGTGLLGVFLVAWSRRREEPR